MTKRKLKKYEQAFTLLALSYRRRAKAERKGVVLRNVYASIAQHCEEEARFWKNEKEAEGGH
jgi:hypothetical protein